MNSLQPQSEQSLAETVYQQVKERIVDLSYPPGSALTEAKLAADFQVSRMPIRLAVRQLENEGWLLADFRRKIRVKPISEKDVREIYQLRELLEGAALTEIFASGQSWEYSFRLEEKLLRIKAQRDDLFARERAESDWHLELVTVYSNERMLRIYSNLQDEAVRIAYHYVCRQQAPEADYVPRIIHGLERFVLAMREQNEAECREILRRDHWQEAEALALAAIASQ